MRNLISIRKSVLACSLCVVVQLICETGKAQNDVKENAERNSAKLELVEATVELEARGGVAYAKAVLNPLKLSTSYQVIVHLKNNTFDDVSIGRFESTCVCTVMDSTSAIIPGMSQWDFSFRLKTPIRSDSRQIKTLVTGYDAAGESPKLVVSVEYEPENALAFGQSMLRVCIPDDAKVSKVRVPFYFTEPMDGSKADVNVAPGFEKAISVGNPVIASDGSYFELSIDCAEITNFLDATELFLLSDSGDVCDRLLVTLRKEQDIAISPQVLRFRPNEETQKQTAMSIMAFSKDQNSEPSVKIISKQKRFQTELEKLSKRIYRLTFVQREEVGASAAIEDESNKDQNDKKEIIEIEVNHADGRSVMSLPVKWTR